MKRANFSGILRYKLITKNQPEFVIVKKKKKKKKEKRTCRIVDFAFPADHREKFFQTEKKGKCLDLVREQKKIWNMKVTVIPIMVGALGTIPKGLIEELEDLEIR